MAKPKKNAKPAGDKSLPYQPQVGDRIRLKPQAAKDMAKDAAAAGYVFDPEAIRTVTRKDPWAPGGGDRLFVDGPPHCFLVRQVTLAWNREEERVAMLVGRGWTKNPESGNWVRPAK